MELRYRLNDRRYTIYHRAALGGLAATIESWQSSEMPEGIEADFDSDELRIRSDSLLSDREALQKILAASFRITTDHMIDLPGQGVTESRLGLRLALHGGYCGTFLHKTKDARPAPKGIAIPQTIAVADADENVSLFTYAPVGSYAHQTAKGTRLLDDESLPDSATIPQWIVPGAFAGAKKLECGVSEAILLLFLIVGSSVFLLRPRNREEKTQYCVIVPDVADLRSFASTVRRVAQSQNHVRRLTNTYLGHVVGGSEEAALRFQIDLASENVTNQPAVRGCLAVAMGKVAWDNKQINRSSIIPIGAEYDELALFRAACEAGRPTIIQTTKGDSFAIPASPLPELIAANFASGRNWSAHFRDLVSSKEGFRNICYLHGGLVKMKYAIRSEADVLVIDAFHEAWKRTVRKVYEDASEKVTVAEDKIKGIRERIRNDILRAKTQSQLSGWFLAFCARATGGSSLQTIREHRGEIHSFLFNPRNFEHLQNLCLFALLSYAGTSDAAKGEDV